MTMIKNPSPKALVSKAIKTYGNATAQIGDAIAACLASMVEERSTLQEINRLCAGVSEADAAFIRTIARHYAPVRVTSVEVGSEKVTRLAYVKKGEFDAALVAAFRPDLEAANGSFRSLAKSLAGESSGKPYDVDKAIAAAVKRALGEGVTPQDVRKAFNKAMKAQVTASENADQRNAA